MKSPAIFQSSAEVDDFNAAFTKILAKEVHSITTHHLDERNTLRYNHGHSWQHHSEEAGDPGHMQTHSAEMLIRFEDVVLSDDKLIGQELKKAADAFHRQFLEMMYRTVSETCDRTGNTISQTDYPNLPQAFLQMLKTVKFGVDKDGNVSVPQFHIGSQAYEKVIPELQAQPEEFRQEVDAVMEEKRREALAEEANRLGRFRTAA